MPAAPLPTLLWDPGGGGVGAVWCLGGHGERWVVLLLPGGFGGQEVPTSLLCARVVALVSVCGLRRGPHCSCAVPPAFCLGLGPSTPSGHGVRVQPWDPIPECSDLHAAAVGCWVGAPAVLKSSSGLCVLALSQPYKHRSRGLAVLGSVGAASACFPLGRCWELPLPSPFLLVRSAFIFWGLETFAN